MYDDEKFELDDIDGEISELDNLQVDDIDDGESFDFGEAESSDFGSGFEEDEVESEDFIMNEVSDSFEINAPTFKKFEAKPSVVPSLFAPPTIRKK
jgi:hypothetical protein